MKKLLFILTLCTLINGCTSDEKVIQKLVESNVKEKLSVPESYETISCHIDSCYYIFNDETLKNISTFNGFPKLLRNTELDLSVKKIDYERFDEYEEPLSASQKQEKKQAQEEYESCEKRLDKIKHEAQECSSYLKKTLTKQKEVTCYKVILKYKSDDPGAPETSNRILYVDKSLEKVIYSIDYDKDGEMIEEVLQALGLSL